MLATLVIGLREGLEAALIVGIIAAFLRNNGKSTRPMWIGVGLATALSVGVGVGLGLVERSLPQAGQEAMESVIGAVAVGFVTTMIVWMSTHARGMKKELEAEAAAALSQGSTVALAVMAFLAVLKEGFETSVFLLATFSAAQSAALAAVGAVIGVLLAVAIGWGIFVGGVKLNLARFFRVTGVFLILVAAGLTVTTLRTAHEAGWLDAGQQPTVNLSWLVAPGSIQAALITGVLGIPAEPRLIEVVGWFAYVVPVSLFVFWPAAHRPRGRAAIRLRLAIAGALTLAAVVLAVALPRPTLATSDAAPLVAGPASVGTATLGPGTLQVVRPGAPTTEIALVAGQGHPEQHAGVAATAWTVTDAGGSAGPPTVTLAQLVDLSGGRLPVGLNPQEHPGPFAARWSSTGTTTVWVADGALLDARHQTAAVVTVSGSGLQSPRTLTVTPTPTPMSPAAWQVAPDHVTDTAAALTRYAAARAEHTLWAVSVPLALVVAALAVAATAGRRARPAPAAVPPRRQATAPADLH